ncbi:hypothetical protein DPMN_004171 [Dreissena polymorpha]|uniref:Uncharacterized protein n=1 Tax=Dreissena polymorpha TaxID=45954 RepID=A0A9D4RSS0_DREPO|nr:hypothetical protein DPMN_004171 [Dreissena polymorpha]
MSPDLNVDLIDTDETALPALTKMNIRRADMFVLVYDFNSFEYIRWIREAIVDMRTADVPITVVGNKIDILARKVHSVIAECFITIEWGHPRVEFAAKYGNDALTAVFEELLLHSALEIESLLTGVSAFSQTTSSRQMALSSFPNEVQRSTSPHFKPQKKKRMSAFPLWGILKKILKK